MLSYLIQVNYGTFIAIGLMFFFLFGNRYFDKKNRMVFALDTLNILLIVVAEMVECWTAAWPEPTTIHIVACIVGYSLRPLIVVAILFLMAVKWRKRYVLLWGPAVLNFLIQLTALFSGIAFAYDANNQFVRGPLGYAPHLTSLYYLVLLIIVTVEQYHNLSIAEPFLALVISVLTAVATYLESLRGYHGLLSVTAAVGIVFYYMYLATQQFKRDELTGVLNRRCFNLDGNQAWERLTALIALDLNNLKTINDSLGHEEGDRAILTITECVRRSLGKHCFLYRTGGDEFMVLGFRQKREETERMLENMERRIQKSPYRCAMGVVYAEEGESFEQLCAMADQKMYRNKKETKGIALD